MKGCDLRHLINRVGKALWTDISGMEKNRVFGRMWSKELRRSMPLQGAALEIRRVLKQQQGFEALECLAGAHMCTRT